MVVKGKYRSHAQACFMVRKLCKTISLLSFLKPLFLGVLFLFSIQNINAQSKKGSFEIGLHGGGGLGSIDSPRGTTTSKRFVYNFGLSTTYYVSEYFGIKTKAIYDNKGYSDEILLFDNGAESERTDININYLTIPLMASLFVGNNAKFYVNAGMYYGLLLGANETSRGTDLKHIFDKNEYGIAAGLGVIFPTISNVSAFFEYDGQFGISDPMVMPSASIRTRRHAINLGVLLLIN